MVAARFALTIPSGVRPGKSGRVVVYVGRCDGGVEWDGLWDFLAPRFLELATKRTNKISVTWSRTHGLVPFAVINSFSMLNSLVQQSCVCNSTDYRSTAYFIHTQS
jgi:hypothetical protein